MHIIVSFIQQLIPVLGQVSSHGVSTMEDIRIAAVFFSHISSWPQVYLYLISIAIVFD